MHMLGLTFGGLILTFYSVAVCAICGITGVSSKWLIAPALMSLAGLAMIIVAFLHTLP